MRKPRAAPGVEWVWGGNPLWESWDLLINGTQFGWIGEDVRTWSAVVQAAGERNSSIFARGTKDQCARALVREALRRIDVHPE